MITIIHPSRGRPEMAKQTALQWIAKIGLLDDQFEYILSIDNDDPLRWRYSTKFPCTNFTIFRSDNRNAIDAINIPARFYSAYRGLEENSKDFLIVISDDFDCPYDWGKLLIEDTIGISDWILKTQDGIQSWIVTLPIMDWTYYRRFNYVYHPDYFHGWSDTEMTCVGELTGRLITSETFFKHNHYSVGGVKDDTSIRADSFFEDGKIIFQRRINKNFDLPKEWIIRKLPDNVYSRMKQ